MLTYCNELFAIMDMNFSKEKKKIVSEKIKILKQFNNNAQICGQPAGGIILTLRS